MRIAALIVLIVVLGLLSLFIMKGCKEPPDPPPPGPDSVKIFLEASGSVTQYFEGENPEFQTDIISLLDNTKNRLRDTVTPVEVYLAGSQNGERSSHEVVPTSSDRIIQSVVTGMPADSFEWKYNHSHVAEIMKAATQKTSDSTLSVVVTDCIPNYGSISNSSDFRTYVTTNLNNLYNFTQQGMGVAILKLESQFNGVYYRMDRSCAFERAGVGANEMELRDPQRPYYLFLFAKKSILQDMLQPDSNFREQILQSPTQSITFNVYNGSTIQNTLFWKCGASNTKPQPTKNKVIIKDRPGVDSTGFLVGFNMKELPEYTKDLDFIRDNLRVNGVECNVAVYRGSPPLPPGDEADKAQQHTHFAYFTLDRASLSSGTSKLEVSLAHALPAWHEEVSTPTDCERDQAKGKTYRFNEFVEGMSRAVGISNAKFFNFEIKLQK